MKRVPAKITINRKTGESTTKYVEITDEEYDRHIIQPLAQILYEQMMRDIVSGRFNPDEQIRD